MRSSAPARSRPPFRGAGARVRWAGAASDAKVCPANGSDVKLRGQGARGYGSAAHGVHACESRDAGRAPPFRFDFMRRLGRRTEAGPRQLQRRVRPPSSYRCTATGKKLNVVRRLLNAVSQVFALPITRISASCFQQLTEQFLRRPRLFRVQLRNEFFIRSRQATIAFAAELIKCPSRRKRFHHDRIGIEPPISRVLDG